MQNHNEKIRAKVFDGKLQVFDLGAYKMNCEQTAVWNVIQLEAKQQNMLPSFFKCERFSQFFLLLTVNQIRVTVLVRSKKTKRFVLLILQGFNGEVSHFRVLEKISAGELKCTVVVVNGHPYVGTKRRQISRAECRAQYLLLSLFIRQ